MNGLKILDLVAFFSISAPTFFPSRTSITSNRILKSEGLNYIRSIKERTKCPVV